jgi:hypothetical protein
MPFGVRNKPVQLVCHAEQRFNAKDQPLDLGAEREQRRPNVPDLSPVCPRLFLCL